jgi:hypothetical protein
MPTITSFHSSAVEPEELGGIMADYLALERARIFRRLLVTRFGLLAAGVLLLGTVGRVVPPTPMWFGVGACVTPPLWAWIVELRRHWRLARRLEQVPGGVTREVAIPAVKKS